MPLPLASRGGLCYDEEKPFSRRGFVYGIYLTPQGLKKALTFSYDDGREFDRRLVEIFNQHGLKGTFQPELRHFGAARPQRGFVAPGDVKELYQATRWPSTL